MSATIVMVNEEKFYKFLGPVSINAKGQEERVLFYSPVPSDSVLSQLKEAVNTDFEVPSAPQSQTVELCSEGMALLADALCE